MKKTLSILTVLNLVFISCLFSQIISSEHIDGHLYFKFKDSYQNRFSCE